MLNTVMTTHISNVSTTDVPRMRSARALSFMPSTMEMREEAPTPTSVPNAWMSVMMGNVSARPEMAIAPAPCPMKIRSTTL